MTFRRSVRLLHRWLGLIVGVQVLVWVTGGLIMSVLKIEEVRGETLVVEPAHVPLRATRLLPIEAVLAQSAARAPTSITLTTLLGEPVYRLNDGADEWLLDAVSGQLLSPLSEEHARRLARADYAGDAQIRSVQWVETPELEFRGRDLPLWRVWFDDDRNTAVYVAPDTGTVVARRNDLWRAFDFVWMLHIMDYETRDDFNHPLLIAFAASALLFVLSGGVMLYLSFFRKAA